MRTDRKRTGAGHVGRRSVCASSAAVASLLLALLFCPGCDDTIREDIRQGALGVFETSLDTLYSEVTTGVTDWIYDVGPSASTSTGTSTTTAEE